MSEEAKKETLAVPEPSRMDRLVGTKFILCAIILISITVIRGMNQMSEQSYVDIVQLVFGGFVAANVFQKVLSK